MNNIKRFLHYLALILGFQASAFFVFFLIFDGSVDIFEGKLNVIPILILMIIAVGGFFWSMLNPKKGSIVMIIGGFLMAFYLLYLGGLSEIQMALIFGLPFIIPGSIFYLTSDELNENPLS